MADISKITLPNGTTYNIKDETARANSGSTVVTHMSVSESGGIQTVTSSVSIENMCLAASQGKIVIAEAPLLGNTRFPLLYWYESDSSREIGFALEHNGNTIGFSGQQSKTNGTWGSDSWTYTEDPISIAKDWQENLASSPEYIQNRTHYQYYGEDDKDLTSVTAFSVQNGIAHFEISSNNSSSLNFFNNMYMPDGTTRKSFYVVSNNVSYGSILCQSNTSTFSSGNATLENIYYGSGSASSLSSGEYLLYVYYRMEDFKRSIDFFAKVDDVGSVLNSFVIRWPDTTYQKLDINYLPIKLTADNSNNLSAITYGSSTYKISSDFEFITSRYDIAQNYDYQSNYLTYFVYNNLKTNKRNVIYDTITNYDYSSISNTSGLSLDLKTLSPGFENYIILSNTTTEDISFLPDSITINNGYPAIFYQVDNNGNLPTIKAGTTVMIGILYLIDYDQIPAVPYAIITFGGYFASDNI